MNAADRWRIRVEAWRDSSTAWLVFASVALLSGLVIAMAVIS